MYKRREKNILDVEKRKKKYIHQRGPTIVTSIGITGCRIRGAREVPELR
jgi:hypothetical protein